MSRARDNRRRKARARRRLRKWRRRVPGIEIDRTRSFVIFVIDDPVRGPGPDPEKVRSFVEHVLGFGPITVPPHLTTGVDLVKGGDSSAIVRVRHTESGRVRIEEVIAHLDSPRDTPAPD